MLLVGAGDADGPGVLAAMPGVQHDQRRVRLPCRLWGLGGRVGAAGERLLEPRRQQEGPGDAGTKQQPPADRDTLIHAPQLNKRVRSRTLVVDYSRFMWVAAPLERSGTRWR